MAPPLPMRAGSADEHTTVLLVRHGHVEDIDPPRFRGRRDLPLTPLGQRQAQALSQRIAATWQPAAVFTSPLGRCVETANAIAQPFGLIPEPVPGLLDLDYGAWQGLADAEVHARWPDEWAVWHHAPQFAVFPDGETLPVLAARATNALHVILGAHRRHTVVIVAHDSVNRVLLLHALDLPLSRYGTLAQAPCGLNVLRFDDQQFRVCTLNETGHLLGC